MKDVFIINVYVNYRDFNLQEWCYDDVKMTGDFSVFMGQVYWVGFYAGSVGGVIKRCHKECH